MAKRLFIAVPLATAIRAEINALIHVLRKTAPRVRWVRPEHMHVTLRFLGDVEPDLEQELIAKMEAVCVTPPFRMNLGDLGAFPDRKRPRVLWTGVQSGRDQMVDLARRVERQVSAAGFEPDRKRFSPHVTLARVREPVDFTGFWTGADATRFASQEISVTDVRLIHSTLTPQGPVYRDVESFPLRGKED